MRWNALAQPASGTTLSPRRPVIAPEPMAITMNPAAADIAPDRTADKRRRIVFVHVGKCAGGSIMISLRGALDSRFVMSELHCDDANLILRNTMARDQGDLIYLVATRDPVARFVSAYNWDKHNIYFCKNNVSRLYDPLFEEFGSVDALALALSCNDPARAERALDFARFGHMGMGPAWYMPRDIVQALPQDRTFLCQTEHLPRDLRAFVAGLDAGASLHKLRIARQKGDFTAAYRNPDTLFSTRLSDRAQRNLRILLDEDIRVHRLLRQRFAGRAI